jgi:hypothetical protein
MYPIRTPIGICPDEWHAENGTDAWAWFDQFPELAEGVSWPDDTQMCPRHWAPCSVLGANGIGCVTELMSIWLKEIAPKGSYSPGARNRQLKATGYICCLLGDERMYDIWGKWGPSEPSEKTKAEMN